MSYVILQTFSLHGKVMPTNSQSCSSACIPSLKHMKRFRRYDLKLHYTYPFIHFIIYNEPENYFNQPRINIFKRRYRKNHHLRTAIVLLLQFTLGNKQVHPVASACTLFLFLSVPTNNPKYCCMIYL